MFGIKIKENCGFGLWLKVIKCANEHISIFSWDDAHLIMEEWPEDIIDCSFLLPNVIGAHPYLLCYTWCYLSRPWGYILIRYLIRLQTIFANINLCMIIYKEINTNLPLHQFVIRWYEILELSYIYLYLIYQMFMNVSIIFSQFLTYIFR